MKKIPIFNSTTQARKRFQDFWENEQALSVLSISFDMNRIKIYKINARNWCQPLDGLKAGRN